MAKTIAGVATIPAGNDLLWGAIGVALGFMTPAVERKIGGDKYASLAPEITELVGAGSNAILATGIGKFAGSEHGNTVAIGALSVAAVRTTVMLARRVQGQTGMFARRGAPGRASFGQRGVVSSLMNGKPRIMLGAGRDSIGRQAGSGPMRMLFTVDQTGAEQLNP